MKQVKIILVMLLITLSGVKGQTEKITLRYVKSIKYVSFNYALCDNSNEISAGFGKFINNQTKYYISGNYLMGTEGFTKFEYYYLKGQLIKKIFKVGNNIYLTAGGGGYMGRKNIKSTATNESKSYFLSGMNGCTTFEYFIVNQLSIKGSGELNYNFSNENFWWYNIGLGINIYLINIK